MCMHDNDDNDNGHNCHQQQGIDIDDLKKCVNCMKRVKRRMVHGTEKLFKALTLLYNGMLIHGVSPSELLIGTS